MTAHQRSTGKKKRGIGTKMTDKTTTRYSGEHPDDRFTAAPFYHECNVCKGEHIAGWGIWDIGEKDWILADGFESEDEATAIARPFNEWVAEKGL